MWKHKSQERFFWAGIGDDFDDLVKELVEIEEEEEVDLFRLDMHARSAEDLDVFSDEERQEIESLFAELISDTKRHSRTLGRVARVLRAYRQKHLKER